MNLTRVFMSAALCAGLFTTAQAAEVQGRYIYFGNPLSPRFALGEIEAISNGENILLKHGEFFPADHQDYLYELTRGSMAELVDGKKNPEDRHVEFGAAGVVAYVDSALYYPAFEVDLGKEVSLDKIVLYSSRYTMKGYQDSGWRYLLILDEQRRIVSAQSWNSYQKPHPQNKGIWDIPLSPATQPLAGRVVPVRCRSWLSEVEFVRDFLHAEVIDMKSEISPEQQERLDRFQRRNSPEEIERLGERFFRVVDLDQPHLREVKALVEQRKFADALEAFKRPFFSHLAPLGLWDAGEKTNKRYKGYLWMIDPDSRATMRARDLQQLFAVDRKGEHKFSLGDYNGDKSELFVRKFIPGLLPPGKIDYPFTTRPLLLDYAANGDVRMLRAWEEMTDDWAIGFQDAADAEPEKLRDHFVLTIGNLNKNMKDLYNAAEARPEFIDELSGATLARFMLPMLEELPVGVWRVMRKCVFNHTFNSVAGAMLSSIILPDFLAIQRLEREMDQALTRLHTLSQYRDGSMTEVCDEGHFLAPLVSPSNLYGMLTKWRRPWFTPARQTYFLDNLRQSILAGVRIVCPNGDYIRFVGNNGPYLGYLSRYLGTEDPELMNVVGMRFDWGDYENLITNPIMRESEVRAVIEQVFGWGARNHMAGVETRDMRRNNVHIQEEITKAYYTPPPVVSDWMPYTGAYFFRRGWEREDSMLHMLQTTGRNVYVTSGGWFNYYRAYEYFGPTSYRFKDFATLLGSVFPTQIDRQWANFYYGYYPSGSKQDVFSQATEKPGNHRWFTDAKLDFGEAKYEGLYHNTHRDWVNNANVFVEDETMIPGVSTTRQILQVRPARLFLQVERIQYATAEETHQNRTPITLLLSEPGPETNEKFSDEQLLISDEKLTVETLNPGNAGLKMSWFGQPELTFTRYPINDNRSRYGGPLKEDQAIDPDKEMMLYGDPWEGGYQNLNGPRKISGRGIYVNWPAQGSTVLLTALIAHRPNEWPTKTAEDLSTAAYAGVKYVTRDAPHLRINEVATTLLVARQIPAVLSAGQLKMRGEALLLVEERGQPTAVIALGAQELSLNGQAIDLPAQDVRFDLVEMDGSPQPANWQPIRRPLDPPSMSPNLDTFTDSMLVELKTSSPDAVIRYTTETPASRMDPLWNAAQTKSAATPSLLEPARTLPVYEEQGADWKVYDGPFRITKDTLVRARTFRRGVDRVPTLKASGTDVSLTSYGFFRKQPMLPAIADRPQDLQPGLNYDYLEGRWMALWTYTDVLPAKSTGLTPKLLDVSMRETDGPFAVRYRGYLDVPADGIYTFYGPEEFVENICEPGYDLRVYVDGKQWYLGQAWHARGQWSIPLSQGLHEFRVTFADARAKDIENQKPDLWSHYPYARTTWRGVAPQLEISGPNLTRRPVPESWFYHAK